MSGLPRNNQPVGKVIPGTSYTLSGADFGQVLIFTNASPIAVTLPAPGTGGDLYGNWHTAIFPAGAGAVTVTPAAPITGGPAPTINGAASLVIVAGGAQSLVLGTNGNWYAPPGGGTATGFLPLSGGSLSGPLTVTSAAPQISLNNATSNWISMAANGFGPPTFSTVSVGTKLRLFPDISATTCDFAIGIDGGILWFGTPDTTSTFDWYCGTTIMMTMNTTGLVIGGAAAIKPGGGPWTAPSARELKEDIEPYAQGLDAVRALNPVSYRYNGKAGLPTTESFIGLVHDETGHMPEMHRTVTLQEEEVDALDHGALVFALINAVKELTQRLEALEGKSP